jgi:hypothetical protein
VYPDEAGFLLAQPARSVYSIKSNFIKENDLTVYVYKPDGKLTKVPIQNVVTTIQGEPRDYYIFGENDPGAWEVGVSYANMEPTGYTITVLSAEEEAYYNNGGHAGIEIIITGP